MQPRYTGTFNGQQFIVEPTHNRTPDNEVKCAVHWPQDNQTDYIWFDDLGHRLVCQLNAKIAVDKE